MQADTKTANKRIRETSWRCYLVKRLLMEILSNFLAKFSAVLTEKTPVCGSLECFKDMTHVKVIQQDIYCLHPDSLKTPYEVVELATRRLHEDI